MGTCRYLDLTSNKCIPTGTLYQKDVKSMRIILDGVKDHLISHLSGKDIVWEMMEALKDLFQSNNENRKISR